MSKDKLDDRIYLSPPSMGKNEIRYIQEAFNSNWIAPLGPFVDRFEKEICDYTGAKFALALSSGSAAIHLALRCAGVDSGDEVLCSTLTFIGSAAPITYLNAKPVFIDSDTSTWNLDPNILEDVLKKKSHKNKLPKVLLLVHIYGQPAAFNEIAQLCNQYGVLIIEDAAESLGSIYGKKHTGTLGYAGIYSFNGNKIITTSGGGMLVSEHKDFIDRARKLSTQAREPVLHYEHTEIGYNYRMSNLLAALGVGQLEGIEGKIKKKMEIFNAYKEYIGNSASVEFLPALPNCRNNFWLSCFRFIDQNPSLKILHKLNSMNIECRPIWKPMHLQPVFKDAEYYGGQVAESLFSSGLCLPSGSDLSFKNIEIISKIISDNF